MLTEFIAVRDVQWGDIKELSSQYRKFRRIQSVWYCLSSVSEKSSQSEIFLARINSIYTEKHTTCLNVK